MRLYTRFLKARPGYPARYLVSHEADTGSPAGLGVFENLYPIIKGLGPRKFGFSGNFDTWYLAGYLEFESARQPVD